MADRWVGLYIVDRQVDEWVYARLTGRWVGLYMIDRQVGESIYG